MKYNWLIIALLIVAGASAQSSTEYKSWTKVVYRIKPSENLKIDVGGQYRTETGAGFNRAIAEVEVKKQMSKNLTYAAEYRHYFIKDDFGAVTGIDQRSRLRLHAERRYDLSEGELYLRYGIQHREIVTGGGSRKTDARVRVLYEFGIKDFKWDPELYTEYLQTLNGDFDQRLRIGISTGNKIMGTAFSIGYFYQRNITQTGPHYHTATLGLRL
jgi:hypothetical protein